jgi:hypothetical protein
MGKKFALGYLVILTIIIGAALAYGFIVGDFWKDGGELMDNPWGIVSLFDVYVGFFFFIGIILAWAVAICVGGNVLAGIYAILALLKSKGDTTVFFMGNGKHACSTKEKEA